MRLCEVVSGTRAIVQAGDECYMGTKVAAGAHIVRGVLLFF